MPDGHIRWICEKEWDQISSSLKHSGGNLWNSADISGITPGLHCFHWFSGLYLICRTLSVRYPSVSEVPLWRMVEFSQTTPAEDPLLKRIRLFQRHLAVYLISSCWKMDSSQVLVNYLCGFVHTCWTLHCSLQGMCSWRTSVEMLRAWCNHQNKNPDVWWATHQTGLMKLNEKGAQSSKNGCSSN